MITDSEYWEARAEEVRAKAELMTHEISREQMLWIVAAFEREAIRWAKHALTKEQHADLKFELGLYDEPK